MTDRKQIEFHGGPAKVAELMGYPPGLGSYRRVFNWMKRGIPRQVKLDHPDLFPHQAQATTPSKQRRASKRKPAAD